MTVKKTETGTGVSETRGGGDDYKKKKKKKMAEGKRGDGWGSACSLPDKTATGREEQGLNTVKSVIKRFQPIRRHKLSLVHGKIIIKRYGWMMI